MLSTIERVAVPAPQDPQDIPLRGVSGLEETATGPGAASCGRTDKPIERPGTRMVATWTADARPTATWSVDPRPTLTMQRRLIARLTG